MGLPALRLSALALVLVCLVGFAQTAPGRSLLKTLGLRSTPTHYTELSFTAPRSLPFNFVRGGVLHLHFDIHNVEGELRLYAWRIELAADDGPAAVVRRGVALVDPGATGHIAAAVRVPCPGLREQVAVRLARPALALRFAASCLGPVPGKGGR